MASASLPPALTGDSRFRGAADGGASAELAGENHHQHLHHVHEHRPAGFGSVLSANASLALRHARSNPLFLNFSAIRAELVAMNTDFASLERQSLDALTVAEAKAVAAEEDAMLRKTDKVAGVHAANRATAAVNALRRETEALHEQDGVLRYLRGLSAEVARANASATKASSAAAAKDATRAALRRDAETAAGAYLGFNMAAAAQSLDAVASFLSQATGAQRAAEAWRADAELRALNSVATHLARLKAAADGVSSSRSSLKGVYSVAGAAARLVDLFEAEAKQARRDAVAAAHVDTGLQEALRSDGSGSASSGDIVEQQAEQFAIVALAASPAEPGAQPGTQQRPFNSTALARPPQLTAGAVRVLHGMSVRTPRIEARTDEGVTRSPDDIVTVSSHDEEAASLFNMLEAAVSRVESMAARLSAARAGLQDALAAAAAAGGPGSGTGDAAGLIRKLGQSGLETLLAALRAALAEAGAQRLGAVLDGSGAARAWWLNGNAVAAEVGRLNSQADRLAAGRRVLEAELERRASRDPAAVSPGAGGGGGGGAGGANFGGSGSGSAVSSLETSVSVTVLRALLEADGSEAAAAAAADEGALRSLLSAGGGTLWHQAAELETESRRVDEELHACQAEPSQFRPGCEPRLSFEASRLREEAAKRRAAAAAERAVLERLAAELSSALQKCRAQPASDAASADASDGCAAVEQAGVSAQLKAVSSALDARRQVEEDWAERTELQCLWRHRSLSLTELIAESLAKPPAGSETDSAGKGGKGGAVSRLSGTGEGDKLRRLTQVCAALGRQPLVGARGADVIAGCLCPDAQASHKLLVAARSEADKAAAARHAADAAQADAASDAAGARAATQTKEETRVKEALFDYLRGRPEWAAIVGKAMSEQEAVAQTPQQAAEGATAAARDAA